MSSEQGTTTSESRRSESIGSLRRDLVKNLWIMMLVMVLCSAAVAFSVSHFTSQAASTTNAKFDDVATKDQVGGLTDSTTKVLAALNNLTAEMKQQRLNGSSDDHLAMKPESSGEQRQVPAIDPAPEPTADDIERDLERAIAAADLRSEPDGNDATTLSNLPVVPRRLTFAAFQDGASADTQPKLATSNIGTTQRTIAQGNRTTANFLGAQAPCGPNGEPCWCRGLQQIVDDCCGTIKKTKIIVRNMTCCRLGVAITYIPKPGDAPQELFKNWLSPCNPEPKVTYPPGEPCLFEQDIVPEPGGEVYVQILWKGKWINGTKTHKVKPYPQNTEIVIVLDPPKTEP